MTFIIAEAGLNHNGKLSLAVDLINAAKKAGADAVKFQITNGIRLLDKYKLSYPDFVVLKEYCDKQKITFLATPHTFNAIHFLDDLVPMYKVASTYLTNPNFLKEVASKDKTILLSTGSLVHDNGMATNEEIKNALSFIPNAEVVLMHCVSQYPCDNPQFDAMNRLNGLGCKIGISDHSKTIKVPMFHYIEKHLMLNGVECVDSSVSLTPQEFKKMVDQVRSKE